MLKKKKKLLSAMYFNFKYPYEASGQRIGIGTLTSLIDDPEAGGRRQQAYR